MLLVVLAVSEDVEGLVVVTVASVVASEEDGVAVRVVLLGQLTCTAHSARCGGSSSE